MTRDREVRQNADATAAVRFRVQPACDRRGLHAGRPDDRPARDALAADDNAPIVDGVNRVSETDLHTEPDQPLVRRSREIFSEGGKNPAVTIDDDDPGRSWIDAPELVPERVSNE